MKVKHVIERVMNTVFFICGMVSIAAVLLITIYMVIAGLPAILEIGPIDFLFGQVWQSTAADPQFGILPFIMTSVWGTLGAVVIGVPIGLCTAIFLSKLAPPKLAAIVHPAVELLAGIPSVVYGLIGMMVLVPGVMNLFDLKSRPSTRRQVWVWVQPGSRPCARSACPLPRAVSPQALSWASAVPSVRPWRS